MTKPIHVGLLEVNRATQSRNDRGDIRKRGLSKLPPEDALHGRLRNSASSSQSGEAHSQRLPETSETVNRDWESGVHGVCSVSYMIRLMSQTDLKFDDFSVQGLP